MMLRARRRRPQTVSFIASESSLSSSVLPAVSMAVSSVPSVKRLGGRVFFRTASTSMTVCGCPSASPGGSACSAPASSPAFPAFLRLLLAAMSSTFQPTCCTAVPEVWYRSGIRGPLRDGGDHRGDGPDMVVVPGREQAAADEVVDLLLFGRQRPVGRDAGRDDGVVVGDLRVVHKAPAQRPLAGAGREQLAVGLRDGLDHPRQRLRHILREMAAVRARIADELVPLVQRLRQVERLLRAEAVEPVGVALQLCEIVERRRRHALGFRLDLLDGGRAGARPLDDQLGLFAVRPAGACFCSVSLSAPVSAAGRNHVPLYGPSDALQRRKVATTSM